MGRAPCDKNGLKKGPWTPEEDQKLVDYIQKHGHGSWRTLPKNAGLQRCGKSCRLRWTNYLRPDIKRGRFSFEEEETIIQLHSILGNKWSAIAARLPGRTDNEIKNYWNTHIRKRLLGMGIDPVTQAPHMDLLDLSSLLNSTLYNSSQSNISRLLGMQHMVNSDVLRLATSLLPSQHENPDLILQNLQQNQLCNLQFQFPLLQSNQLQNPNQESQACTTSGTPCAQFLDETPLMQPNVDQFQSNSINLNYSNSQPNVFPGNLDTTSDYVPILNYGYQCSDDQSIGNPLTGKSNFQSNEDTIQALNLPSLLSTPSSSPTPLNSSLTNINSSTEDERDTNCSGVLPFELQDILDVNEFI